MIVARSGQGNMILARTGPREQHDHGQDGAREHDSGQDEAGEQRDHGQDEAKDMILAGMGPGFKGASHLGRILGCRGTGTGVAGWLG